MQFLQNILLCLSLPLLCFLTPAALIHADPSAPPDGLPRTYEIRDVRSFRDCGGWRTTDGRRVRRGRIFRSRELNNVNPRRPDRNFTLSDESRDLLTDTFGIRTDIDLRDFAECTGMEASPLGDGVARIHVPGERYQFVDTPAGRAAFARVFHTLLDERNLPAIIHCRAGRDRTGCTVLLLNALLGVSETDLRRDWEFTERQKGNRRFNYGKIDRLLSTLARYPGDTVNAQVEAFVRSLGFDDADIVRFREIMLE